MRCARRRVTVSHPYTETTAEIGPYKPAENLSARGREPHTQSTRPTDLCGTPACQRALHGGGRVQPVQGFRCSGQRSAVGIASPPMISQRDRCHPFITCPGQSRGEVDEDAQDPARPLAPGQARHHWHRLKQVALDEGLPVQALLVECLNAVLAASRSPLACLFPSSNSARRRWISSAVRRSILQ